MTTSTELVEFMLRIFQSLVIDPGRPPHRGKELRAFLRRWVAPAISAPVSQPRTKATKAVAASRTRTRTKVVT